MKYTYLLLFVVLFGCKEDSATLQSIDGKVELINDQNQFNNAWNDLQGDASESDPFSLNSMTLNDGVLTIEVSHGGGCEEHDYSLLWSGGTTFIDPPQVTAILMHDANSDFCEAYLTNEVEFVLDSAILGWSINDFPNLQLTVVNGYDSEETLTLN